MNVSLIIDVVILVIGLYFLYITISMKKKNKIPDALLVEEERKKVKDVPGFIRYMFLSMMICSLPFVVLGICCLILDLKIVTIPYANYVLLVVFMTAFLFCLFRFRKAKSIFIK